MGSGKEAPSVAPRGRAAAAGQDQEVIIEGIPPPPRGVLSPRRAPEVDMEWPPDGPAPGPEPQSDLFPVLVLTLSVMSLAVVLTPGASGGLRLMVVALLAGLAGTVAVDEAARWWGRPGRALERALWAIYLEEEPREVAKGLEGVVLPGRAGLCLGIAVRCLYQAGRCRRVERAMGREAARWVRRARGEMGR